MNSIHEIDEQLTAQSEQLKAAAADLFFLPAFEFDLSPSGLEDIPLDSLAYSGLYQIEVKNSGNHATIHSWVTAFVAGWTDPRYKRMFVPNPKKGRIMKHLTLSDWIPLYIGKSKNISKRVWEHIHLGLQQPTFALKLKHREHLLNDTFRLSTVRIDVENYYWIMPVLERSLRDKVNPIVGRQ